MTEFTPEWIAKVRLSSHLIEPPAAEVIGELLDEITRLQSRVQELEDELMFYQMECPDLVGRYQPPKDGNE